MLHVVAGCCGAQEFVIHSYFRPLFGQKWEVENLLFLPSPLFQGHTLKILREGWRLHYRG